MSVFKTKKSPYYQFDFQINNQRFQGSTGKTSEREAIQYERDEKRKVNQDFSNGIALAKNPWTLDLACGTYFEEQRLKLSPGWAENTSTYLERILGLMDQRMLIKDLGAKEVNKLVQDLRAHYLKKYGTPDRGMTSINRHLGRLRRVLNYANKNHEQAVKTIDWGMLMEDEPEPKKVWITVEKAQTLFKNLPPHIAIAVEWSLLTGLRLNHTFTLTDDNINLEAREITFLGKGRKGKRKVQQIPLSRQAIDCLNRARPYSKHPYIFDRTNRSRHWALALKKAGIKNFTWHDLRHTYATWLRQRGVAIEVVQQILGHADLATTMRYAHVAKAEVQEAVQKVPALLPSSRKQVPKTKRKPKQLPDNNKF